MLQGFGTLQERMAGARATWPHNRTSLVHFERLEWDLFRN